MRVRSLVPVQESLQVDHVAHFQFLDCLVDIRVRSAQIRLHRELIRRAVYGDVKIQIVAFLSGAVPVVQISRVAVADGLNGHSLEGNELVLFAGQFIRSQERCDVLGFRYVLTVLELPDRVDDFDFAGPLRFVALDLEELALLHQLIFLLRAGKLIQEIGSAVLVLQIDGGDALFAVICLLALDRSLDHDFAVDLGGRILLIGHGIFGNVHLDFLRLLSGFRLCRRLFRRLFSRGCLCRGCGRRCAVAAAASAGNSCRHHDACEQNYKCFFHVLLLKLIHYYN